MKLLIVEKQKIAAGIAEAFNWSKFNGGYKGVFENEEIVCVPLRGHIVEWDEPKNVIPGISWDSMEHLLPVPKSVPKVRIPDNPDDRTPISTFYNNVEKYIKVANEVILGTDCDAEGEYIGWELIEHFNFKGRVRRAWLAGGVDSASLRNVMNNLREPHITRGMAYAAEARSYSDYLYQLLTRAYTYYARRGKFGAHLGSGGGKSGVMSVGRVQSAVVGIIVERERQIQSFVPVTHYKLSADFTIPADPGYAIEANYENKFAPGSSEGDTPGIEWKIDFTVEGELIEKPMFVDRSQIAQFEARLKSAANQSVVVEYKEGEEVKYPPKTYNTSEAMMDIAKECKVSAGVGQHIIEDLYEQGFVSYPRTTKSDLPISIYQQRNDLFDAIVGVGDVANQTNFVKNIHNGKDTKYKVFQPKVYKDEDMPHFGLVPSPEVMTDARLRSIRPQKKDERQLIPHTAEMMIAAYKLIIKRFVQAHYPPARFATQAIRFMVPVEDLFGNKQTFFVAKGRRVVDLGFMDAFKDKDSKDSIMKPLQKGQAAHFAKLTQKEQTTEPPKRFSEDDLIISLEKINLLVKDPKWRKILKVTEGLGTPATRKNIVKTILFREYVEIKKGYYYPTNKGYDLVDHLEDWMIRPEYTAMWEDELRSMYTITDQNKNRDFKDAFIAENIKKVEGLIEGLIQQFGISVEYAEGRRPGGNVITPKMIAAIKKICEARKISVPAGLLKDAAKASAFLDEAIAEIKKRRLEQGDGPSEKQIELAKKLSESLGDSFPPPANVLTDREACRTYLDAAMKLRKPSEAQINLARKIADKLPDDQKPKEEIYLFAVKCSEFIDKNMKKSSGGASGSKGAGSKPAGKTAGKPAGKPRSKSA
jgi:DNA topoisomerase IA